MHFVLQYMTRGSADTVDSSDQCAQSLMSPGLYVFAVFYVQKQQITLLSGCRRLWCLIQCYKHWLQDGYYVALNSYSSCL